MMCAAALFAALLVIFSSATRDAATGGEVAASAAVESFTLSISELMSSNKTAVPDDTGTFGDWIEFTNTGTNPLNLNGIGLSDDPTQIKYIFPDVSLEPGAALIVWASGTYAGDPGAPLHAPFKLSASGESVCLFDARGALRERVDFPALNPDTSYAKAYSDGLGGYMPDDPFAAADKYTPGYPNTDEGYKAFRQSDALETSAVRLNEIMPLNRGTIFDEDGDASDWIELINTGTSTAHLEGYALSDDESKPMKWRFPKGASIKPGGVLLVFASGKNRANVDSWLHTGFKLDGTRETILLSNARGQLIDRVTVEGLNKDESWMRPVGMTIWQAAAQTSPNQTNDAAGVAAADVARRFANESGLIISEVVTYSSGMLTPYGMTSYDWVEILNAGSSAVNLLGYGLSDKPGRPRLWQFPNTVIEPGEYKLVFLSGLEQAPKGSSALHAQFRLSALGGQITLSDPSGKLLDMLPVPAIEPDTSFGRSLAMNAPLYFDTPTPGAANAPGVPGYAAAPIADTPGGGFHGAISVSLTAAKDAIIRYTLDGSDPSETSAVYTQPIAIGETTVLRARAYQEGLRESKIVTNTYLIGLYHQLPVISIVTDPDNLWNPLNGIYAGDYTQSSKTKVAYDDLPYWQKNTVAGSFEFFETDGTRVSSESIELGLHGQFSLDIPQKSFRITAKARYGSTELAYQFFPDRPYDTYQSLVLRNGGNDGKYTRIVDGLQSRMVDWTDTNLYHMPWRPAVVYLNGQYWGHYNIRERVNAHSLARYEGWDDPDNVDLIKGDNSVLSGSFTNYSQLLQYVKGHDLNDPEALATVLGWIDVDNYFDYMIFEMYFGNTDTGNIKFYRLREPGEKWKWVLFDLDWGMYESSNDGCKIWLDPAGTGENNFDNTLILKLLEVPSMRDKFLARYGQLFQETFKPERMIELAREMAGEIDQEMSLHFNRWAWENTQRLDIEAPASPEGAYAYWKQRLSRLENVINKRGNLTWGHVQNWFKLSDEQMRSYFGDRPPLPSE
jgi:hypothetical protein